MLFFSPHNCAGEDIPWSKQLLSRSPNRADRYCAPIECHNW